MAEPATPDEITALFRGAKREIAARHLETLALIEELQAETGGRYAAAASAL